MQRAGLDMLKSPGIGGEVSHMLGTFAGFHYQCDMIEGCWNKMACIHIYLAFCEKAVSGGHLDLFL